MQHYTAFLFDAHRNPLTKASFCAIKGGASDQLKTYLHIQNFGNQVVLRAEPSDSGC